ncbi:MAG: hypothetical protein O3C39_00460 [Planctomycetota bacterium]|jgi:hypothetical protein|nr:hypothetical protein [Planctomycetota bacterium]MDA1200133.1 hypothetical protein [Planctomycetota bacterium]
MRWLALLIMSLLAAGAVAGEQREHALPVTARVTASQTLLRAGPGDDFYPTARLGRSTEVEVWAIDLSGYCAVRPLEGSFSWVRAADVEIPEDASRAPGHATTESVGVVVNDATVARIGSQLNDLRHVSQVALEAGERVVVLERVSIPNGRHAGDWLRIKAPAGEFRWAWAADLDLPPALVAVADETPSGAGAGAGLAAAAEAIAAVRDASVAVTQAVADVEPGVEAGVADDEPGMFADPAGVVRLLSGWLPRGTNVFDLSSPPAAPAVAGGAAAVPADELADIDLALSLAVAGPSEQWNLSPIRERLRLAATRATSGAERTRAEAIDARLSRFEAIQARQQALVTPAEQADSPLRLGSMWSSLSTLGSRPIRPGVLPGGRPADGRPDWTPPDQMETTGRLATVISRRPDAPRWALVDGNNNVLVFVTPRPGVSLAPMVGQQVTVRGARGYMPEYKRPYLVASEARPRVAEVPSPSGGPR